MATIRRNSQWIASSFFTAAVLVSLSACTPSVNVGSPVPESVIPEGLKDCTFFQINTAAGGRLHVIRCPNSSTSVARIGKNPVYTSTSDDESYLSAEAARIDREIKRLQAQAAQVRAKAAKE